MKKRSSREQGTTVASNGRSIARIAGVAAILVAVAYFGISAKQPPHTAGEATSAETAAACADGPDPSGRALARFSCESAPFPHSQDPGTVSTATAGKASDPITAGPPANARRRFADPNRGASELPLTMQPQPGLTLAEICVNSSGAMSCRTGKFAAASFVAGQPSSSAGEQQGGVISGRVMTAAGEGVPELTIVASPDRGSETEEERSETTRFWTATDMFGAYSFQGLPEGEYTIRSSNNGKYQSARTSARTGVDYADLVIPATTSLVASGLILTPMGEPLEGVTVLPVLTGQPSVLSDNSGSFHLPVVLRERANAFALRFQRPGFMETTVTVENVADTESLKAMKVVMKLWSATDSFPDPRK